MVKSVGLSPYMKAVSLSPQKIFVAYYFCIYVFIYHPKTQMTTKKMNEKEKRKSINDKIKIQLHNHFKI